jgi:hypothetical protein
MQPSNKAQQAERDSSSASASPAKSTIPGTTATPLASVTQAAATSTQSQAISYETPPWGTYPSER